MSKLRCRRSAASWRLTFITIIFEMFLPFFLQSLLLVFLLFLELFSFGLLLLRFLSGLFPEGPSDLSSGRFVFFFIMTCYRLQET